MSNQQIVRKTADFIRQKSAGENTGHDWWHIERVWKLSKRIAQQEKEANLLVVELAALLHDIADHKFHNGDMGIGPRQARRWLDDVGVPEVIAQQIEEIIRHISFRAGKSDNRNNLRTIEGRIVHDADKLDAMGAIGIARLFTMAGAIKEPIYDPEQPIVRKIKQSDELLSASAIHHFNEKLIHLKDRMFTKTGKELAQHRHEYMNEFLNEFYSEWEAGD